MISLNIDKCTVLHFWKQNKEYSYHLGQTDLASCGYARDLGIVLNRNFSFKLHATYLRKNVTNWLTFSLRCLALSAIVFTLTYLTYILYWSHYFIRVHCLWLRWYWRDKWNWKNNEIFYKAPMDLLHFQRLSFVRIETQILQT